MHSVLRESQIIRESFMPTASLKGGDNSDLVPAKKEKLDACCAQGMLANASPALLKRFWGVNAREIQASARGYRSSPKADHQPRSTAEVIAEPRGIASR